jgi:hypothetical protein
VVTCSVLASACSGLRRRACWTFPNIMLWNLFFFFFELPLHISINMVSNVFL